MFIFQRPEIQNKSRNRPQLRATDLPSQDPCRRQLVQDKGREGSGCGGIRPCPGPHPMSPRIINSHLLKPQGETPPLRPHGSAGYQESLFRWCRIQGLHFIGENGYQNTGGETRAGTGQAPGDTVLLSIHQILTLSLLSWGQYWLAVLLQSPHSAFSSFCSCFLRKSSHHWTQTLCS